MKIQQLNPIGYQTKTDKGNTYKKSNLATTIGIVSAAAIDISPKIKEEDLKLPSNVNNELSQLIGIYFDNAIEAAYNSSKKQIALEVYKIKDSLFFVITNSYKGNIKLNNITKKGFSTKGNSRGKGLYFANKIVKNSKYFNNETKIIDDYFIQKLEVRKK